MRNLIQRAHGRAMKRALGDVIQTQPGSNTGPLIRYDLGEQAHSPSWFTGR